MKIGFVIDDTLDKPDGVQQYVLTLSAWLKTQGHEVHYLVGETKRMDLDNIHSLSKNVKVRFNRNRLSIPLPSSKKSLQTLMKTEKFDVLHVQMPHNPLLAAKLVKIAKQIRPKTAVVGTFHIAPYSKLETRATRVLGVFLKQNLRYFDRIISVSSAAQAFAQKTFKIDTTVLPNVVNLEVFKTKNKHNDPNTIVFLGRLVERKGCEHLLRAMAVMKKANPDLNFSVQICGDGPDRSKLEQLARTLKVSDSCTFIGFVTEEEKKRYLSHASIAVFPSTGGESFGIVLIEAMAAGSGVVIGGDNPGYRSVLGELPETLFDATDHQAFASKLTKLLEDTALSNQLHTQQQQLVKQYDVAVVGPKIIKIYTQAIAKMSSEKDN